jgi:hypothetical protein
MSGMSSRKQATNCPFKLTFMKTYLEPVYKLQADYTSYHNHRLPIDEMPNSAVKDEVIVKREPRGRKDHDVVDDVKPKTE